MRRLALSLSLLLPFAATGNAAEWMMHLDLPSRSLEGRAIAWNDHKVHFLSRDGRLWDFGVGEPKNYHRTAARFRGYSQAEMRAQLLREFGRQFDVSGTGNYLVVHPAGQRDLWAQRFEELYRSFVHYFSVRGFRPTQPPFPLVAIVFQNQRDYLEYSARSGNRVGSNVLGYYSAISNRIVLYDQTAGQPASSSWAENAATIVHEATHQTAFNTGIHNRFAPQPLWLVEGVGMMFEAGGVWDSRRYTSQADRINRGRLRGFQKLAGTQRGADWLVSLVSSDKMFRTDANAAYSDSWALSFYLAETQPRQYFQYLAKVAARPAFVEYTSAERLRDFSDAFGSDFAMLNARLIRFTTAL